MLKFNLKGRYPNRFSKPIWAAAESLDKNKIVALGLVSLVVNKTGTSVLSSMPKDQSVSGFYLKRI